MKIVGIVAEFNPYHNGHAYMIEQVRARVEGEALIICAMSGNWMQRGEPAIAAKFPRAQMAVTQGADLVLELPTPWAVASAGRFAHGAVSILAAAGVDTLAFGSECGSIDEIALVASCLQSEECQTLIVEELTKGVSYPTARHKAVKRLLGEGADLLEMPNNNLAVEYMLAAQALGVELEYITVSRYAVPHDSLTTSHGYASAQYVRECIRDGAWEEIAVFVPEATLALLALEEERGRLPADLYTCERMVLSRLRQMTVEDFFALPDVSEGLENRLFRAAKQACCIAEFFDLAKSKRVTHARLRRILIHALLNTGAADLPETPPYLRVLAATNAGQKYLRRLSKASSLPVVTRATQMKTLSQNAQKLFRFEEKCTDLYVLTYPDSVEWTGGSEWRARPYFQG